MRVATIGQVAARAPGLVPGGYASLADMLTALGPSGANVIRALWVALDWAGSGSTWTDRAQSIVLTSGGTPTYDSGSREARFASGSSQKFERTAAITELPVATTEGWIWAIADYNGSAGNGANFGLAGYGSTGTATGCRVIGRYPVTSVSRFGIDVDPNNSGANATDQDTAFDAKAVVGARFHGAGASIAARINSADANLTTTSATFSTNSAASSKICIGTNTANTVYFTGGVSVFGVATVLDAGQQADIEATLTNFKTGAIS